jgi:predicted Zn-dependent peptidase
MGRTTLQLHTPTAQMDSALALFADVALRPAFPINELERLRKDRLTSLLQVKDRGPEMANRAYAAIVFGAAAYGRPLNGDEATTKAIQQTDVRRFYDTYFRPNNATLLVVGDVKPEDVERRVRALFGNWERRPVPAAAYGQPSPAKGTTIYVVDKRVPHSRRFAWARRRRAQHAGLLPAHGNEYRVRRLVHESAEPNLARPRPTRTVPIPASACGGRPVRSPQAPRSWRRKRTPRSSSS